jgi:hypothetical protein
VHRNIYRTLLPQKPDCGTIRSVYMRVDELRSHRVLAEWPFSRLAAKAPHPPFETGRISLQERTLLLA